MSRRSLNYYHKKYWEKTVIDFINYYNLDNQSSILDVGCAKGFMLYEIKQALPGIEIKGIDISQYAINNSKEEVRKYLQIGNASNLDFEDSRFDLVISLVTIHNLNREVSQSLKVYLLTFLIRSIGGSINFRNI